MTNFDQLFIDFSKLKVVIIGDVMLDTYWWGQVDRISPEAPVPVVALQRKEHRGGGGANVALNTVALGAQTTIVSVIGTDADGVLLKSLFEYCFMYFFNPQRQSNLEVSLLDVGVLSIQDSCVSKSGGIKSPHCGASLDIKIFLIPIDDYLQMFNEITMVQNP
jgi:hypothetical protein